MKPVITKTRYAVIDRPGCFAGNKSRVWSTHACLSTARRRASGSTCVICAPGKSKGDVVYGDTIGTIYPVIA